ncbi:MAG TPA: T9SS type A sorting domain-containing protein, partial [Candidatus Kapabacteria bacterium]
VSSNTQAAVVIDSVWADSIRYNFWSGITSPELILGPSDNKFAEFGNGAEIELLFKTKDGSGSRVIKKGATVNVYCQKHHPTDSSAGYIKFDKLALDESILYSTEYFLLHDGLNVITLPDKDYTVANLTIALGATGFEVDAVQLIQPEDQVGVPRSYGMSGSRIVSNYPNPFLSGDANGTTLRFTLEHEASVGVVVIDALGREVSNASLGMMSQGTQEARVSVPESGMYIARLVIDGEMTNSYYKLIAR